MANNNDLDENGFRTTRKDPRMPKAAENWRRQLARHAPAKRQYGLGYYHGKKGDDLPTRSGPEWIKGWKAGQKKLASEQNAG